MKKIPPFHTSPEQWAQGVAEQYPQSLPPNLLISDVDDTLLDSNLAWYQDYVRLAVDRGVDEDKIVNPETFSIKGPRIILTEHHELLDTNEYLTYKRERMHDPAFHEAMQPLDDANTLATRGFAHTPDGYISTRPAALGLVTHQNLTEVGFAPTPLLLRPEYIPYEETVAFKIVALASLRHVLTQTTVRYVDDYKGVIDAINNLGDDDIQGIHYGSHTWQEIVRNRRSWDVQ